MKQRFVAANEYPVAIRSRGAARNRGSDKPCDTKKTKKVRFDGNGMDSVPDYASFRERKLAQFSRCWSFLLYLLVFLLMSFINEDLSYRLDTLRLLAREHIEHVLLCSLVTLSFLWGTYFAADAPKTSEYAYFMNTKNGAVQAHSCSYARDNGQLKNFKTNRHGREDIKPSNIPKASSKDLRLSDCRETACHFDRHLLLTPPGPSMTNQVQETSKV